MLVLVDVDHVICDSRHRHHMVGIVSWEEYYEEAKHDEPVQEIIDLVNALEKAQAIVIGMSMRPERYRAALIRWLIEHKVNFSDIVMRKSDDFRSAPEVKRDIVSKLGKIDLLIDDARETSEVYNEITKLQVRLK
jgi:hypothetical protein